MNIVEQNIWCHSVLNKNSDQSYYVILELHLQTRYSQFSAPPSILNVIKPSLGSITGRQYLIKKYGIILVILRVIHNWETILGNANL